MIEPSRILVVDDDADNREILEQELELLGCQAIPVASGREAIHRIDVEAIDLVLLDIMMPEMDGFEVLRRIKASPRLRHLPVIMISARDDEESVIRCIELGAEDHLAKPFDPVLLKARIGACLEKKRLLDQEAAYRERMQYQMEEIERERERADQLLHMILPPPAVAELKAAGRVTPRRHDRVAVLFGDIIDFTHYCEQHSPEQVVGQLDRLIEDCEQLATVHGLEKIKTIGDGILATANLLRPNPDPVMASLRCAFAMAEAALRNPARWQLRFGLHFGPVVAGVVGRSKFSFDIWGDTVNVAARLSDLGPGAAVHLSGAAWAELGGRGLGERLGPLVLKGKGKIEVYRCRSGM